MVTPSGAFKTRTSAAFVPSADRPFEAIVAEFERLQAEVIACVRAAEGLPIDRVTIVSPFGSRVRYNVYAAFTILPRHQHRHLLQAERAGASAPALQA
jgi:hypothetical protein